jgi:conserved hypothetical protein
MFQILPNLGRIFYAWAESALPLLGSLVKLRHHVSVLNKEWNMSTPKTQNLTFGFYGTMHLAGVNAASIWETAVAAIERATLHEDRADIAAWLDSKEGRHFADYVAEGLRRHQPIKAAVNGAVRTWMLMRPDAEMVRAYGVPEDTPYLVAVLRLIADWV